MKQKKFSRTITPDDILDVSLEWEKKKIRKFALNYRAFIDKEWREVYRVDNFHGYLHEQKFWRSKKPIPIKDLDEVSLEDIVKIYTKKIHEEFHNYRKFFKEAMRKKKQK